jgi:hypothetical protein
MAGEWTIANHPIGDGGLLRRFETATHLTSLRRQILSVVALTWAPFVLFGSLYERISGREEPLLHDASVHVRLLVAVPMFLLSDRVFPPVCRRTISRLVAQSFVPEAAGPRLERLLRSATRLIDSPLPELLFAMLGLAVGLAALLGFVPASGLTHRTQMTAAQLWYGLVELPLFQFLLWRSLWRWAVWVRVLAGLSRIDLDLVDTHPDRRGGIRFLRAPSIVYCAILLFAISSVLCAVWGEKISETTTMGTFKPFLLLFATVGTGIAFGPLLVFTPRLLRARRDGVDDYGGLANDYGRRFHRRWIESGNREGLLGTGDIQSLTDLATAYRETVERLRLVLFDGYDMAILLAATLLPVVPVLLSHMPVEDVLRKLAGLLTGSRLR